MATRTDKPTTTNMPVADDLLQMARVISGHKDVTINEVIDRHLRHGRPGGIPREYRETVAAMAHDIGGEAGA